MAGAEGDAELSIVETPSYALAVVLLFFLTITFVADLLLKNSRRFLERRSSKGLLVSPFKWLGHTQLSDVDQTETCRATCCQSSWPQIFNTFPGAFGTGSWRGLHLYPVSLTSQQTEYHSLTLSAACLQAAHDAMSTELLLLGFASLILAAFSKKISKICGAIMHPNHE